jgi:excisionase family DNA binding protein
MDKEYPYITTNEAAEILDVTPEACRRYARAGRFGAHKRGGIWWLEEAAIREYKHRIAGKGRFDPTRGEV